MKKALIFYFTQGGTTETISNEVAGGLKKSGYSVDQVKIPSNKVPDIQDYDIIGIGFPVYAYRAPYVVTDFLKSLPSIRGKHFFVFMLYGSYRGKAGNSVRKLLARKGGIEAGYSYYHGSNLYYGYLTRGYHFSPDHPDKEERKRAREFGSSVAAAAQGQAYNKPPFDRSQGIVYEIEKHITSKFYIKYNYSFLYKADKKKCSGCGICVKKCPRGNITLNKNKIPEWGRDCLLCMYCQMYCPEEAITSAIDWPVMSLFFNYNIKKAEADKGLDMVKVELKRGKIKRLK